MMVLMLWQRRVTPERRVQLLHVVSRPGRDVWGLRAAGYCGSCFTGAGLVGANPRRLIWAASGCAGQ